MFSRGLAQKQIRVLMCGKSALHILKLCIVYAPGNRNLNGTWGLNFFDIQWGYSSLVPPPITALYLPMNGHIFFLANHLASKSPGARKP